MTDSKVRIYDLEKENERLIDWVNDLQSGMYLNCAYCGYRFGHNDDISTSMSEELKKHIEQCPKHPLFSTKKENERLQKENEYLRKENEKLKVHVKRLLDDQEPRIAFLEKIAKEELK